MPYAIININGKAVPADVTYGSLTDGTGNISVFSSNNTVIGNNTVFSSQLGNNFVLRDYANVYVGKISNVISNTSATLSKVANINITDSQFKFQSYSATEVTYDEHLGNGYISIFTSNSTVVGTDTNFTGQLDIGYQIFDNSDIDYPNLLGVIKTIHSNTTAYFTTVSAIDSTNIQYRFYNPVKTVNVIPQFVNNINGALIGWGQSGLIQGTKQVKSYHPPLPDPVTGVLVNFPATIHHTGVIGNIVEHDMAEHHLTKIGNSQKTKSNFIIKNFDSEHAIFGSSTEKAVDSISANKLLRNLVNKGEEYLDEMKDAVATLYGKMPIIEPMGIVLSNIPENFSKVQISSMTETPYDMYKGPGGNVIYVLNGNLSTVTLNTIADRLAFGCNLPAPDRIMNSKEDIAEYFNNPKSSDLSDADRADLAARANNQFTPKGPKQLTVSGVPAVIPGQLNAVLYDEDPGNRTYKKPRYRPSKVFEDNIDWNKDIPISSLNRPPVTD